MSHLLASAAAASTTSSLWRSCRAPPPPWGAPTCLAGVTTMRRSMISPSRCCLKTTKEPWDVVSCIGAHSHYRWPPQMLTPVTMVPMNKKQLFTTETSTTSHKHVWWLLPTSMQQLLREQQWPTTRSCCITWCQQQYLQHYEDNCYTANEYCNATKPFLTATNIIFTATVVLATATFW